MRSGGPIASGVVIVAVATMLTVSGCSSSSLGAPSGSTRETCSTRSAANFPGAFTNQRNLVVGPMSLVGGGYTSPETVRQYGGNKFPLLVKAGHTVTVRISRDARRTAGLAYGRLPQGEITLRDAQRTVTFVACRAGRPSGNHASGTPITFWSGFVLTRAPACVPLEVYVDDEASPRRVGLPLGRRCEIALAESPAVVAAFCRNSQKPVPTMCPSLWPGREARSPLCKRASRVRPGRLELPRGKPPTRPSTLRVYQFRHRRVCGRRL